MFWNPPYHSKPQKPVHCDITAGSYVPVWRWFQCTSSSSASPVSDHEQTELSLPQSLLLFKYRREPRGNTVECPSQRRMDTTWCFLGNSVRRTAWIVKAQGWICWLVHSFPPSPRASSLTLLSITPNPMRRVHSRTVLSWGKRLFIVKHDL